MYVYMYIYICICIYMYMYIYVYVYIYRIGLDSIPPFFHPSSASFISSQDFSPSPGILPTSSPSSPFPKAPKAPKASAPKASSNKLPDICIVEIPVVTMMPLTPASGPQGPRPLPRWCPPAKPGWLGNYSNWSGKWTIVIDNYRLITIVTIGCNYSNW